MIFHHQLKRKPFRVEPVQKINNKLSGNIVTKLRGSNIKDLIGDLKFIDFNYSDNELNYDFEELVAQSRVVEDKRIINITSPDAIDEF